MYQRAFDATKREDIGIYLFLAVLRVEDLRRLFTHALSLKAMFNNTRYVFWAAMALHLQSKGEDGKREDCSGEDGRREDGEAECSGDKCSEDKDSQDKNEKDTHSGHTHSKERRLAQQMVQKEYERTSTFETVEELNLFLMLCGATEDAATALRVFLRMEDSIPSAYEKAKTKVELLLKTGNWDEALETSFGLMRDKGVYDWEVWRAFSRSYPKAALEGKEEMARRLLLASAEEKPDRNKQLARVDAALSFGFYSEPKSKAALLLDYAIEAPQRSSRIPDMVHLLGQFADADAAEFVALVDAQARTETTDLFYWCQLQRVVRTKAGCWTAADAQSCIDRLAGAAGEEQAYRLWTLALLSLDRYVLEGGRPFRHLVAALTHLRQAIDAAPEDFVLRLLVSVVLVRAGCVFSALGAFRLDIKQIQIDTLGHLLGDHLLNLGDVNNCEVFFHEAFFIYDDNRTQSLHVMGEALIKHAYSKVPELYELFIRLEHSIQAIGCIVETVRSELFQKPLAELLPYLDGMKAEELFFTEELVGKIRDNRDRDVVDFLDQAGRVKHDFFDPLPAFNLVSIWVFTSVTILFKALATGDQALLGRLAKEYMFPACFQPQGETSPIDRDRSQFVLVLLGTFTGASAAGSSPGDSHAALVAALAGPSALPSQITGYEDILACQWPVEQLRWACLAVALFVHGQKPKARRAVARHMQPTIDALRAQHKALEKQIGAVALVALGEDADDLENAKAEDANVENANVDNANLEDANVEDANDVETEHLIHANWKNSLANLAFILQSSEALLVAL